MKIVAFNGSARKNGNTAALVKHVFKELEAEGIECELVELAGQKIRGCKVCLKCIENQDRQCAVRDDIVNSCINRMLEADGIILASPTYFANVTSEMKALIDRTGYVARSNSHMFKRKVGAAVVAVRRAGSIHVFNSINHFFLISQMIIPGSSYWNVGIGRAKGEVENDQEGIATMKDLGKNMAWLLQKIAG